MPTRPPEPLTDEERQIAEEMWGYVRKSADHMAKLYPKVDFHGAIAERLCRAARRYDPSGSTLKNYAFMQVRGAIADAKRESNPMGLRRTKGHRPNFCQLVTSEGGDVENPFEGHALNLLALNDPTPPIEDDDTVNFMLRELPYDARMIVRANIVEGRPLKAIGRDLGISESRANQIKMQALELLRERRHTA